ncbi:MAG: DUF2946 domain-containing protein [Rhodocyclaceae bacterium]|nr:DUF2946 domain-containing protein [Rhodocyclaceae bacterium]
MSRTNLINLLTPSRRPLAGACLGLLAWLALLVSPIAAQAMTRIDTGLPGAVICSANKTADKADGKLAAVHHCQACTLAQQAVDTPSASSERALAVETAGPPAPRAADTPPSRAAPRAHPPRAPPLS